MVGGRVEVGGRYVRLTSAPLLTKGFAYVISRDAQPCAKPEPESSVCSSGRHTDFQMRAVSASNPQRNSESGRHNLYLIRESVN